MTGKFDPTCACVACDGSCEGYENMIRNMYEPGPAPTPPCPECGGSGLVEIGLDLDTASGDMYAVTDFCQCDTGRQIAVDYETEQVGREEAEREGWEINR